jgi:dihydroflavonol-4-reductase
MNSRTLVTGGGGFIGSHLVDHLLDQGHAVRVLERPGADVQHLPLDRIELVEADIRDADGVEHATRDCKIVVHLAANPNLWSKDPHEFETVNHQGTRNVLDAARQCGAHRTVYVSTESILSPSGSNQIIDEDTVTTLDDMIGPYCRSKWLAEQAAFEAAARGEPVITVRPSVPVGPGDYRMGPCSRMMCDFAAGRIKGYLEGDINLIDVRDIAGGIMAALEHGTPGQPEMLVNEHWSILELFAFLSAEVGIPPPRFRVPWLLALGFAHLEEIACRTVMPRRTPMATVTGVKLTRRPFRFDGRRSSNRLALSPMRDCRESLVESLGWYRSQGHMPPR